MNLTASMILTAPIVERPPTVAYTTAKNPDSGFEFSIGEVVEVTVRRCKAEAAGFTRWTETMRATVNSITQRMVYLTDTTGAPRVVFRDEIHKANPASK